MLNHTLVTKQTGPDGKEVKRLYIEEGCDIARELYMGMLLDRESSRLIIMASTEGGMEIEEVAEKTPEKILKITVDPATGIQAFHARQLAFGLGLEGAQVKSGVKLIMSLFGAFKDLDCSMVEINPLVVTGAGDVMALDAKVGFDDNALFRHEDLAALEGPVPDDQQGDDLEARAKDKGLQYVKLDGDIGIMGNGAGLVMSTLDVVSQAGGEAANFLDAGGGASAESMAEGIAFVLGDPAVKVMLINIFGGITRCDDVANGVLGAMEMLGDVEQKLVVRLDGNSAEEGRRILEGANNPKIVPASQMIEAAEKAVALAKEA